MQCWREKGGYVDDEETELYYLRSRFYCPNKCRFCNSDSIDVIDYDQNTPLQYALFSYCHNCPVAKADDDGYLPFFLFTGIVGALAGAVIGAVTTGTWEGALKGAAIGGAVGLGAGAAVSYIATGSIATTTSVVVKTLTGTAGPAVLGTGTNTVYISKTVEGVVQYVGITNDFARRALEHLHTKGITITELIVEMSRYDARAVEQCLIEYYGLMKNGGTLLNRINSIAQSNPIYAESVQRGWEILQQLGILK